MKLNSFLENARARTATGIVLSLLVHALLLVYALDRAHAPVAESGKPDNERITVNLLPQVPAQKSSAAPSLAPLSSQPISNGVPDKIVRKEKAKQKRNAEPKKSAPVRPLRQPKPAEPAIAAPSAVPATPASAAPSPAITPQTDMTDMLNAARERRRAAGIQEPNASDNKPRQDDSAIARANVAEMMQKQSRGKNESGGVFQITFKGVRSGEFIFRGWDVRRRSNTRQLIMVDAPDGDIDTAMVRRMIELIRIYEKEDFQWNSPRLGRVVTLSARTRDSRELEEFLKRDFFEATR